jgi:hypothetical protein
VRVGAYARSALGPFGTRLSGLLGCPSLLLSPPSFPCPLFPLLPKSDMFICSVSAAGKVQPGRDARSPQTRLHGRASAAAHVFRRRARDILHAVGARALDRVLAGCR